MAPKLTRFALAVLLLGGVLSLPVRAGAQSDATFFISNVDASNWPDITFEMRAVDLNNQVVNGLTSSNIAIYENDQPVSQAQVVPRNDGPINVIYVIDEGNLSNYARGLGLPNTQLAIETLVHGRFFVDGSDQVAVLTRVNTAGTQANDTTVVELAPTSESDRLVFWSSQYNFAPTRGRTRGLLGVQDAVARMAELVPQPGTETAVIIFMTRVIEDPVRDTAIGAAQALASTAAGEHITIHTFHTDYTNSFTRSSEPLQQLSAGTGGLSKLLTRNDVATPVTAVYQAINTQRTVYSVTYRSTLGTSGERTITINNPAATGLAGRYTPEIRLPTLKIVRPQPDALLPREATLNDQGQPVYSPNLLSVTAQIQWPEGAPVREIQSAVLRVDGEQVDQGEISDDEITFEWDISGITTVGRNTFDLEVAVTDEMGLEATTEGSVSIDVRAPPTVPPPPTPVPTSRADGFFKQFEDQSGVLLAVSVCAVLLLAVGAIVAVLAVLRPRQRRLPASASPAAPAHPRPMGGADNTLIVGQPSGQERGGMLTVLEGPREMMGQQINLTRPQTVLGRSPQQSDITFFPNQASSVSRRHCTVQLAGGAFTLIDLESANGTWVNGQKLRANAPVPLNDGDEIILGDLAKMGVKLRFSAGGGSGGDGMDRTFILPDFDKDQEFNRFKT